MNPPFDFNQAAQLNDPNGYPFVIDSLDLMKNFVYATTVVNPATPGGTENLLKVNGTTGMGGHPAREFYVVNPVPDPPQDPGIFVLVCKHGILQWYPTEECGGSPATP